MEARIRIALLEADESAATALALAFEQSGWDCERSATIAAFRAALQAARYDLLVLDWSAPDGTAEDLIPWVREHFGWQLPLLITSVHGDEAQIVRALGLGADDYAVKPLRVAEVKARIQALLRRSRPQPSAVIRCGPYRIDSLQRTLSLHGEPLELTRMELELATHLFQHAGELLSRERLLTEVWGVSGKLSTRTVDAHVSRLRKKLRLHETGGVRIVGLPGYGYRLEREPDDGVLDPRPRAG